MPYHFSQMNQDTYIADVECPFVDSNNKLFASFQGRSTLESAIIICHEIANHPRRFRRRKSRQGDAHVLSCETKLSDKKATCINIRQMSRSRRNDHSDIPGVPFAVSRTWQVKNPLASSVLIFERSRIHAILCT